MVKLNKNKNKKIKKVLREEDFVGQLEDFYKKNPNDKIWWTGRMGYVGEVLFSFDKKKVYNFWTDYPQNLTQEEKEIFDKENPFWHDFYYGESEDKSEDKQDKLKDKYEDNDN